MSLAQTMVPRGTRRASRPAAEQGPPGRGGPGVARRPLLGHRQRLAQPPAHHDQLHAGRDEPRRRRHEQPLLDLQQQVRAWPASGRTSSSRPRRSGPSRPTSTSPSCPTTGRRRARAPTSRATPGSATSASAATISARSTLALTYQPPPANNFSIAGDMTFNTGQSFNIGSTYDLFTVAMHEFGHALGLNESSVSRLGGVRDVHRQEDRPGQRRHRGHPQHLQRQRPRARRTPTTPNGASNGTLSTAASINSQINTSSLTALVPNLDITTAGQSEYFSFTAPAGTGSTLELDVQSSGLSLLAPKVTVYALERLDRAGQRQRGGAVRDDADGERLERHRRREVSTSWCRGRTRRRWARAAMPWASTSRGRPRPRRRRPSWRCPTAIPSTPAAARPTVRRGIGVRHRQPGHHRDHPRQRRQQPATA